mgnify:CR=1 FL=1
MDSHFQVGNPKARAYVSGRFELEINNQPVGVLNAVDGGHFKSEPIGEQVGGEGLVTRYPGRQKWEDITITCGASMSQLFWDWIKECIDNNPTRRSGAIVARDFDNRERSRRTFIDAIISEIQFPQLDLKSKSPKNITVKIAPEQMSFESKVGPKPKTGPGSVERQKKQTPQNFGFKIEGIDDWFTSRVVKIDAFSVKQNVINAPVGGLLYAPKETGRIEHPTISIYTPEAHITPWMKWWEQFVGRGEHIGANERTGSITYLNSTFQEELIQLDLRGIGITGITFDKLDGHVEQIRHAKIDLYVETMSLKSKG